MKIIYELFILFFLKNIANVFVIAFWDVSISVPSALRSS